MGFRCPLSKELRRTRLPGISTAESCWARYACQKSKDADTIGQFIEALDSYIRAREIRQAVWASPGIAAAMSPRLIASSCVLNRSLRAMALAMRSQSSFQPFQ